MVSARDCHGFCPLHYAARHGATAMIQHLLNADADVTALDSQGYPPLYHSVVMEEVTASQVLLTEMLQAQRDWRKADLRESLFSIWGAAAHSKIDGMKALAEDILTLVTKAFPTIRERFFGIAKSGETLALQATKDISEFDHHWGRYMVDPEVGLKKGVMDYAVDSGCAEIATQLLEWKSLQPGEGKDLLISYSSRDELLEFVKHGKVPQFRTLKVIRRFDCKDLLESLMMACDSGKLDMAHEIWSSDAAVLIAMLNDEQKSKLAELGGEAAARGHVEFIELIIEAKVPLDHEPARTKMSMMARAAATGQVQVLRLLHEAGAELKGLYLAVSCGQFEAAKAMLQMGADVHLCHNQKDPYNFTPVGQAIRADRPEMLQLLIDHGAQVATEDWLAFAKGYNRKELSTLIQELILRKGAE